MKTAITSVIVREAFAFLVLGLSCALPGNAAAPLARTQAPGYYRFMLGGFEITALNDGVFPWAIEKTFLDVPPEQVKQCFSENFLTDPVDTSVNAFLINTGTKLVLIDTGTGDFGNSISMFHGTGHLLDNLRAAGYQPEQIDEVYVTHMHADHLGGLLISGNRAFPNATLRMAKEESDFILNPSNRKGSKPDPVVILLERYIEAGKFQNFDGNVTLVPGISALATHGHTPGHTSYVVESSGQKLVVWGDLLHVGAVQFPHPEARLKLDMAPAAATTQRKLALQAAAESGYWVASEHAPFPGIGHVRLQGGRYSWVPANYSVPH